MFLCYRSLWSIIRVIHWKRALSCWTRHYGTRTNPGNAQVLAPIPVHQVNICCHNPLHIFISLLVFRSLSLFFIFTLLLFCFFWHTFFLLTPTSLASSLPQSLDTLWKSEQTNPASWSRPHILYAPPPGISNVSHLRLGCQRAAHSGWGLTLLLAPADRVCSSSWIGSNKQMLH